MVGAAAVTAGMLNAQVEPVNPAAVTVEGAASPPSWAPAHGLRQQQAVERSTRSERGARAGRPNRTGAPPGTGSALEAEGTATELPAAPASDAPSGEPATDPARRSPLAEEPPPTAEDSTAAMAAAPVAAAPVAPAPVAPAPPAPAPVANGSAPAGGMFPLVPPDSALPSGDECARRVQRNAWEPRPENTRANQTTPTGSGVLGMGSWFTAEADGGSYRGRVDGNFTGTTDEIIQWASCKWGFPTDLNRAQAVSETTWEQAFVGDGGESFGLYQMRRGVWGGYPNSQASTAFNADWAMGLRRACYDGAMWYAGLRGNLDACIGVHYSGDPDPSTWRDYTDSVMRHLRDKPWLSWSSSRGTPPTAGRAG